MSHFACPKYRSVLTRRDAIKVAGLGLSGIPVPDLFRPETLRQKLPPSFPGDGNPIFEVFA